MKKLMVAFAAVVMAVGANAGSVDWKVTGTYAGNSSDKIADGSIGYLYLGSSDSLQSTIIAALSGVGATDANTWLTANTSSSLNKTSSNGKFDYFESSVAYSSGSYYAYAIVFDTDKVTDSSKFYVTSAKAAVVPDSGETLPTWTATDMAGTKTASNWSAVSVPEPTSGLLLLLGMAGLALKRKRA